MFKQASVALVSTLLFGFSFVGTGNAAPDDNCDCAGHLPLVKTSGPPVPLGSVDMSFTFISQRRGICYPEPVCEPHDFLGCQVKGAALITYLPTGTNYVIPVVSPRSAAPAQTVALSASRTDRPSLYS